MTNNDTTTNFQIIQDRQLGIPDREWIRAARLATAAGHRTGGHDWWAAIRAELNIPHSCQCHS